VDVLAIITRGLVSGAAGGTTVQTITVRELTVEASRQPVECVAQDRSRTGPQARRAVEVGAARPETVLAEPRRPVTVSTED
jgi:hypothetical protein